MLQPLDHKSLETPEANYIDRLSALPDAILLHVLSFLFTENAAATSILSTRWRHLFLAVLDIDLKISVPPYTKKSKYDCGRMFSNFINLGYRLVLLRHGAPIRKFKLDVLQLIETFRLAVDSLIFAALLCKVQELEIFVEGDNGDGAFPLGIFTCKTLVVLHLAREVDLIVPDPVSLPNLKVLYLETLKLVHLDSIRRLIQGCPSLEELYLVLQCTNYVRKDRTIEVLDFSSPSLMDLALYDLEDEFHIVVESKNLKKITFQAYGMHNITINAPNLEYFDYEGYMAEVKFIQNTKSIGRARIGVKLPQETANMSSLLPHCLRVFELVNEMKGVESLYLSEKCVKVFRNDFYEDKEFVDLLPNAILLRFIEHLKEIIILAVNNDKYEFKVIEYHLQNVKDLKKMTLGVVEEMLPRLPDSVQG